MVNPIDLKFLEFTFRFVDTIWTNQVLLEYPM